MTKTKIWNSAFLLFLVLLLFASCATAELTGPASESRTILEAKLSAQGSDASPELVITAAMSMEGEA